MLKRIAMIIIIALIWIFNIYFLTHKKVFLETPILLMKEEIPIVYDNMTLEQLSEKLNR